MRFLGLAILWLLMAAFFTSIGVIVTAMVLTTIAMLDFIHEFVFYGASALAGAVIATAVVRKVYLLQESPTLSKPSASSVPKTSTAKEAS